MTRRAGVLVAGGAAIIDLAIVGYAFTVSAMLGVTMLLVIVVILSIAVPAVRARRTASRPRIRAAGGKPGATPTAVQPVSAQDYALSSEFAFKTVIEMAAAIHKADMAEFKQLAVTLKREDPSPAHVYAWALLRGFILERDGTRPDENRIAELVSEASLHLRSISRVSDEDAARVLRIVFGDRSSLSPDPLQDFLIVVFLLGALVAKPLKRLPMIRPAVIRFCANAAAQAPEEWGYLVRSTGRQSV